MMIDTYELSKRIVNSLYVIDKEQRSIINKKIKQDIIKWFTQKDIFFVDKIDYSEEINILFYNAHLACSANESPYTEIVNYFCNLEENFHKNYLLQ